jgi:hypothetical protein
VTRATRVRPVGTFADLGSALAALSDSGDVALVVRGRPRWLVLRCPDGCGENVPVNLDQRAGPAWRLHEKEGISIYPSIWRETGCESHFVIWRNRIWWGFEWDDEFVSPELEVQVIRLLDEAELPLDALAIATRIDAEPWTVLVACNKLFREKRLARHGKPGAYLFFRAARAF